MLVIVVHLGQRMFGRFEDVRTDEERAIIERRTFRMQNLAQTCTKRPDFHCVAIVDQVAALKKQTDKRMNEKCPK